jgi:hypothetical protein
LTWTPTAWRWVVGPWNAGPERELVYLSGRQLQYTINAPATAGFNLPGTAPECEAIAEGETDLWVWAADELIYRGRVISTTDTISGTTHTLSVATADYRGVLARRLLVEGDSGNIAVPGPPPQIGFSTATYAEIAWRLVSQTQAKPAGQLGIVQGVWIPDPAQPPSGYRVRHYDYGLEVGKAVDDLANDAPFDYDIRPRRNDVAVLEMNLYAPGKARNQDLVLDLGGTVTGLTRSFALSGWANVTRVSGSPDTTVGVNAHTASPEGRWETQVGYPDVTLQSTVNARATAAHRKLLARHSTLSLELRPGVVNSLSDLDVGDTCLVAVRSGRLDFTETHTVANLAVTIDDDGITSVRVGVVEPV